MTGAARTVDNRSRLRVFQVFRIALTLTFCLTADWAPSQTQTDELMTPMWIWSPEHIPGDVPQGACHFRKTIHLTNQHEGIIRIAADDVYEVFINGKRAGQGSSWETMGEHDISKLLREGKNTIAIKVVNRNGQAAGLAAEILVHSKDGPGRVYLTNPTWRTSLRVWPLWNSRGYRDGRWKAARNIGLFGQTEPWAVASEPTESGEGSLEKVAQAGETAGRVVEEEHEVGERAKESEKEEEEKETGVSQAARKLREQEEYPEFSIRSGFQIQHVVGHQETNSLLAMAFDEFGQILASQESGPLLVVYDSNDNGTPDKVRVACYKVLGCQGILPLSGKVYVIGEGPAGAALYRLEDRNKDGELECVTSLVKFQGSLGEQGPHGMALGPDGMIYVALGNHTRLNQPFALTSPYRHRYEGELVSPRFEDPRGQAAEIKAPGGGIMRVDLEGQRVELFAGGLRNACDLAFGPDGDLFTYDSDMESDVGTPWYRPTRLLHVSAGAEFGWRSGWTKWPDYQIDTLPAVLDTGRGAPTGCVFYDHRAFPAKYRRTLFSCDWSQGEIRSYRLDRRGAGFAAHREVFLRGQPLNVTDIDVGPEGGLYFCTGGRETRGNIFRIVWKGDGQSPKRAADTGVEQIIRQMQLESAWGRQAAASTRQAMDSQWDTEIREFVADRSQSPEERARGLQLMHLLGPPPSDVELLELSLDPQPLVRAKAVYLMGLIANETTTLRMIEMLRDETAFVRRLACEALARNGQPVPLAQLVSLLNSPDRFEAWAARRLLEKNETDDWQAAVMASDNLRVFVQGATAMMIATPSRERALAVSQRFQHLAANFVNDVDFIDMLRTAQLALERGPLTPQDVPALADRLALEFPAGNVRINRELTRLLVYLQAAAAIDPMLDYLASDAPQAEKLHVAMHLRFLKDGWSPAQRQRLLTYLESAAVAPGGSNLALYLEAATKGIVGELNAAQRATVLEQGHLFPKTALATLFALPESEDRENFERLRELDRRIASRKGPAFQQLKIGLIAVLARGGEEVAMAYLREVYDREPERRQALAMGLAQRPGGRNWDYLIRSIPLLDGEPAREVLAKLRLVDYAPESAEHIRQVILCGLRLQDKGAQEAIELLKYWTGTTPATVGDSWQSQLEAWQTWYEEHYPHRPIAALPSESGANKWTFDDLLTYLSSETGAQGSAARGAKVYAKARCADCHAHGNLGQSYGPDLASVGRRFQVREVLESIIYPSQVIADQYESYSVITQDSRKLTGLLVPLDKRRVKLVPSSGDPVTMAEEEIEDVLPSSTSSMPEGLLNQLSLPEIADLFAFLTATPRVATQPTKPSPR